MDALTVVGIVAHVAVVAALESEESTGTEHTACHLVVCQTYQHVVLVLYLDGDVCHTAFTCKFGLVNRCGDLVGASAGGYAVLALRLAVVVKSLAGQCSCSERNVPVDDAVAVVVWLYLADLLAVEQKMCLWRVGVAYDTNFLSLLVVPGVERFGTDWYLSIAVSASPCLCWVGADVCNGMICPERCPEPSSWLLETAEIQKSGVQSA